MHAFSCLRRFEIHFELLAAAEVLNFDLRIAGAVAVRRSGDLQAVFAGLGELGLKTQAALAVFGIAVVAVAVADEALRGSAFLPVASDFGLRIIHDDALERFGFNASGGFWAAVFEDLAVLQQSLTELGVGHVLHRQAVFERHDRSGGGALPEDHEHGLHADGTIGDVCGGHGHGHEQVGSLASLRNE